MNGKIVTYYINPSAKNSGRAEYALGVLLEGIGLPCAPISNCSQAAIVYSTECPDNIGNKTLWIKCCPNDDWDTAEPPIFWENGIPWLGQKNNQDTIAGDILYSTYGLLTGVFETDESKDQWGVPIARGSLYESTGLLQYPWIAKYCEVLYCAICKSFGAELQRVPLWPDNKKYAIVLSHDVDAPFSFIDTDFRKKWLNKLLSEKRYQEFSRSVFGYLGTLTKKIIGIYPKYNNDPNFCFDSWMEFQRTLHSKSAFYVATATSADKYGDNRDVNYIHSRQDIAHALHCLVDQGWEIGLHGSINAWRSEERIHSEKVALQRVMGEHSIIGVRHHYWALDDKVPERTLAMHARVGFKYDSSLGLNDAPGYRRGLAWPFNPYDKSSEIMLPIIEIPPTLMDGGIFYRDVTTNQGKKEILDHVKRTFESGGAVVLNWHLEQLNPSRLRRAGPTLVDALLEIVHDSEIYWASPKELCEWWSIRREKLKEHSL
jgi:hypothetical protein